MLPNNVGSDTGSEVMAGLEFIVKDLQESPPNDIRQVGIQSDGEILTRLFRVSSNCEDTFLHAPPAPLAYWILDNWWRILHEPEPAGAVTVDWLLAHEMSSIGGGYAWPPIRIWGEGDQVGIRARPQSTDAHGPVRFEADHNGWLPTDDVEQSFDAFLERVREVAVDERDVLLDLHQQIRRERADAEVAIWRTIEAELGFDVDEAPVSLMHQLNEFIVEYGQGAVSEACMSHQGSEVIHALQDGLWAIGNSRTKVDLSIAVAAARTHTDSEPDGDDTPHIRVPPWRLAEEAAGKVRENLSIPTGPVPNWRLRDILGLSTHHFRQIRSFTSIPYGIRQRDLDAQTCTIALSAGRREAKRFHLCRVLGDAIWSPNDRLGLISSAKSARQKFQRAFAQSFLCPFGDLFDYIGTDSPTPDDITAAAQKFRVSERTVQTTLVNKGVIDRQQFERMIGEAPDAPYIHAYA